MADVILYTLAALGLLVAGPVIVLAFLGVAAWISYRVQEATRTTPTIRDLTDMPHHPETVRRLDDPAEDEMYGDIAEQLLDGGLADGGAQARGDRRTQTPARAPARAGADAGAGAAVTHAHARAAAHHPTTPPPGEHPPPGSDPGTGPGQEPGGPPPPPPDPCAQPDPPDTCTPDPGQGDPS
ncbi:hypothetical protein [Actinomadura sp. SCN-SB]|uniref:hypothetical protein n=1 Tax=Actinomadura sp. SCN-SB TaxID=3373092 RepID=UPI00375231A6